MRRPRGEPQRWYCPRCRRFVQWQHRDFRERARAMKKAWREGGFRCHFTGVTLDEDDPWSPWSLDHRVPGGTLVVAAWWVNAGGGEPGRAGSGGFSAAGSMTFQTAVLASDADPPQHPISHRQ